MSLCRLECNNIAPPIKQLKNGKQLFSQPASQSSKPQHNRLLQIKPALEGSSGLPQLNIS
jgi:hypothetical protein